MARRKTGEGSWGRKIIKGVEYLYFRKTYNGKTKYFYGKTQKEVKDKIKVFEKTLGLNSDKEIRLMSFFNYAIQWLVNEKKDSLSPKTYDGYETFVQNKIKNTDLGDIQIGKLRELDKKKSDALIRNFFNDLASNYSKSMINIGYTVINQVFEYAISNEILGYNPTTRLKKPKIEKQPKKIIALNNDELELLWNELHRINTRNSIITGKEGTPVYGLPAYIALFIAYTGLRYGEVAGLHRDYVNFEEKYITVKTQVVYIKNRNKITDDDNNNCWKETLPKGNKTRVIPLADRAIEIIKTVEKRYPEIKQGTLQFSRTGNPISESNINRVLKNMCKRAGIEKDVTPHTLRHTFASILLNEDEKSLPVISEILGHSSVEVTYSVYIDIFMKKKAQTIEIFNNLVKKNNQ